MQKAVFPLYLLIMIFLLSHCKDSRIPQGTSDANISEIIPSRKNNFQIELVAQGMKVPWSMNWLPDGSALVSDRRAGKIYILAPEDTMLTELCNAPQVMSYLDSGMREVLVSPDYTNDGWIYLSYDSSRQDSSSTLIVARAQLEGNCLVNREVLFEAKPWYRSNYHYGGRLVCQDDYLYISVGDRHFRDSAQYLHTHNGKIMRIKKDGSIPDDNPFVKVPGAKPEIWSYGHRNPQGLALHPETGDLWQHEHGPKGGDEINMIQKGRNYGWPLVTFGEEYEGGPVGTGLAYGDRLEQPFRHYSPSVAPSGLTFYTGKDFPEWQGDLFFGAMSQRNCYRLKIQEGRIREEERLLGFKGWRIRFISQGPDGLLYFGTGEGAIWRILPPETGGRNSL